MRSSYSLTLALLVLWPLSLHADEALILGELQELRSQGQEIRSELHGYHEDVIRQGERIEVVSKQSAKHEVELYGRPGNGSSPGLVRTVASAKESQTRHSRLLWGVAGVVGTIIGGVGLESARRRLWPRNKKEK